MSYTIREAKNDLNRAIDAAIVTGDAEALHKIADRVKGLGEDEFAENLRAQAVKIENYVEDDTEDDDYQAECHSAPSEGF